MRKYVVAFWMSSALCLGGAGCGLSEDVERANWQVATYAAVVGTYQAEDHTFQNGCTEQSAKNGYTGSGYMDYGQTGTMVEWNNVHAPSAGQCTLVLRYLKDPLVF